MKTTISNEILTEVWEAKDALSAKFGHNLAATCRAIYAEQKSHPERFVNLGAPRKAEQEDEDGKPPKAADSPH